VFSLLAFASSMAAVEACGPSMLDTQVDHVAIAVRDIRAAMRMYCDLLGARFLFAGDNPRAYRWAQFRFPNGGKVELVTPLADGFVQRFLDDHGEGVHHLTLKTKDILAAIAELNERGVSPLNVSTEHDRWKEAFIHPRDAHGVLVQIAESPFDDEEVARHHLTDHSGSSHRHLSPDEL
jgi:methylmalonyl-CoA/ethylmalonyl-CoA epimerase